MVKATHDEIKKEVLKRVKLLQIPRRQIKKIKENYIPITTFNVETQYVLESIHVEVLNLFNKNNKDGKIPYYITESYHHGSDVISILYVDANKENWSLECEKAINGEHNVFSYIVDKDTYEFCNAYFTIEDDVLWRVD